MPAGVSMNRLWVELVAEVERLGWCIGHTPASPMGKCVIRWIRKQKNERLLVQMWVPVYISIIISFTQKWQRGVSFSPLISTPRLYENACAYPDLLGRGRRLWIPPRFAGCTPVQFLLVFLIAWGSLNELLCFCLVKTPIAKVSLVALLALSIAEESAQELMDPEPWANAEGVRSKKFVHSENVSHSLQKATTSSSRNTQSSVFRIPTRHDAPLLSLSRLPASFTLPLPILMRNVSGKWWCFAAARLQLRRFGQKALPSYFVATQDVFDKLYPC